VNYDPTSAGSYSVSDEGCRGDCYLVSPKPYPVPGYLRAFESLRKALKESVNTCELQQGVCWVIKREDTLDRCGQRQDRGECETIAPYSPGFAGLGNYSRQPWAYKAFPGAVRRSVEAAWKPLARVTREGVATVKEGCVLPLWRQIFYVGDENNQFERPGDPMLYQAAVNAAMLLARQQRRPKVIFGAANGKIIPVVYVEPGGIVRAGRGYPESLAARVTRMDQFEMQQALAASAGASLMPFNM
jgi:hypothetical protein